MTTGIDYRAYCVGCDEDVSFDMEETAVEWAETHKCWIGDNDNGNA